MAGKKKEKKKDYHQHKEKKDEPLLFPDVWWKSPPKKQKESSPNLVRHDGNGVYGNDAINYYGSIHSTTTNNNEEEGCEGEGGGETTSLIDKIVPSDLLEYVVGISCNSSNNNKKKQQHDCCEEDEFGVPSDISNHSYSSSNDNSDNSNSYYDSDDDDSSSSEYEEEDEIEQPHRTIGLIFFDFIRFVAISANVRCINTQMMPVFISWSKMDVLNVVLRIFIAMFSLLLILVEFPDMFPFLQHAISTPTTTTTTRTNNATPLSSTSTTVSTPPIISSSTTTTTPPLYITNWIPRGIFYIFIAIICFEQSLVVRAFDEARHASTSSRFFDGIFIVISAWFMLIVGMIYIVFGIFCIQRIMERVRIDEKEKWNDYYDKVHKLEMEREEAEDREWLLENGGHDEQHNDDENDAHDKNGDGGTKKKKAFFTIKGSGRRCLQNWHRWRRRCKRRRRRGDGGLCYQLGCRTVDWRC